MFHLNEELNVVSVGSETFCGCININDDYRPQVLSTLALVLNRRSKSMSWMIDLASRKLSKSESTTHVFVLYLIIYYFEYHI